MEGLLFALLLAAVVVVGLGLGLAVAPRLARWDERRSRGEEDGLVDRREGDGRG